MRPGRRSFYDPISQAPPDQEEVPVSLGRAHMLLHTPPAVWMPHAPRTTPAGPRPSTTNASSAGPPSERRCAVIDAETVLLDAALGFEGSAPEGPALLPSPTLMAAAGVTDAGVELLEADPDRLLELLEQLDWDGFAREEVLDDALATVLAGACPTCGRPPASRTPVERPSTACPLPVPLLRLVILACIDTGPELT
ncbi:hypothetical protein [Streptomyces sp. 891-h]|uniref:hypothetical protein n=1 Tax=Streptomyces sp. 891-h TaxID=2720714 RepID=UPI001FA95F42|nr:hypothetical protein [Streptomyces sp. 891-h]UNZ15730.1 hypothetical protein HC362_00075 [Streptomyces sp. 891-h]